MTWIEAKAIDASMRVKTDGKPTWRSGLLSADELIAWIRAADVIRRVERPDR